MDISCCVCGTQKFGSEADIIFHPFPKCPKQSHAWKRRLDLMDVNNLLQESRVCSKHFSLKQYHVRVDVSGDVYKKLRPDALPDLLVMASTDESTVTVIRNEGNIDENKIECSKQARKAFSVLKGTIRNVKQKLNFCHARNHKLKKENQILKEIINQSDASGSFSEDILDDILRKLPLEDGNNGTATGEAVRLKPNVTEQTLQVESLRGIVCRLCFETQPFVPRMTVFSPFAGENFLSDVIRTCFGINIKEDDFCTDICEQCLVKVDLTWQFYTTIYANSKALNDLYSSVKHRDTLPDICKIIDEAPEAISKASKKMKTEHASNDLEENPILEYPASMNVEVIYSNDDHDSCSLPDHPFFVEHSTPVYNCHLCPKTFEGPKLLNLHLLQEHSLKNEEVLCHYCAKFYKPRTFFDHVKLHSDRKYVCSVCSQTYSNNANLSRHMRLHIKQRPYGCKQCDVAYNQAASLKQHVQKVHLGIMPPFKGKSSVGAPKNSKAARSMSCPVCDESFYMQSKLITHLEENHPDYAVTIITCNKCPQRFLKKASYHNHRLYRHSEKEYQCDECGEIHASALHLNAHKKRHQSATPVYHESIKVEDEAD